MKLYASLAAALALFLSGMRVEAWRESYGQVKALEKQQQVTAHENSQTQVRTLAAATRIQAVGLVLGTTDTAIDNWNPQTLPPRTGDTHAAPTADSAPVCPDPFADPAFRLLYDAGSTAQAPTTNNLPPSSP